MMEEKTNLTWAFIVLAAIIGAGAGYYIGIGRGVAQEKAAQAALKLEADKEAAKAVNPFEQTSLNPFEKAPTNPFEDVTVNPFK